MSPLPIWGWCWAPFQHPGEAERKQEKGLKEPHPCWRWAWGCSWMRSNYHGFRPGFS